MPWSAYKQSLTNNRSSSTTSSPVFEGGGPARHPARPQSFFASGSSSSIGAVLEKPPPGRHTDAKGAAVCASPLFGVASFIATMAIVLFAVGCSLANTTALALNPFVRQAGAASAMLGTIQLGAGAVSGLIVGVSYNGSALPLGLVVAGCGVLAGVTLRTAPAQT